MRLSEVAARLEARLEGDGTVEVRAIRSLDQAGPDDLTFLVDERHLPGLAVCRAAAVILAEGLPAADRPTLRTPNPYLALARALALFHPLPSPAPGIHATAVIASDARVDPSAAIGPLCVVGPGAVVGPASWLDAQVFVGAGVAIGSGCHLYPHVTLYEGTRLGDRVIIHGGAVIGADGFGYARDGARYVKIPQVGCVVLEDDVEIGANAAVDRATLGETRIGRGTKVDNLVQIAHNVRVGEDTVVVSQVGISGSTRIGSRVTLAGQAGVRDHVSIGDGAIVGAQAGVSKDIPAGSVVLGSPAIPHGEFKRQVAAVAGLPAMRKLVRALETRLAALEARLQDGRG